jgi:lysozyme
MKKAVFLVAITFAVGMLILSMLAVSFNYGFNPVNYPSEKNYPVRGIDISHYQKSINWEKLQEQHIDFIIMKVTEGGDFTDRKYKEYYDSALQRGYKIGVYHFYRFCTDPQKQAQHFLSTIGSLKLDILPAIDLEFGGNCKVTKSPEKIIEDLTLFLTIVEQGIGRKPLLYATMEFYSLYMKKRFDAYPLWIRDVFNKPGLNWTLWQYTGRGRVNGIAGPVDKNVYNGSKELFIDWCNNTVRY